MASTTSAAPSTASVFTFDSSLQSFDISLANWLSEHGKSRQIDGIAAGAAVFNTKGQLLVIQRAANDSMPNRWELPGGAVDPEDLSILHGAARELYEEAGLTAARFTHSIIESPEAAAGTIFHNSSGTRTFCCFVFAAETNDEQVRLDPNEHQAYLWVGRMAIEEQKHEGKEMPITTESVRRIMLEAFRLREKAVQ